MYVVEMVVRPPDDSLLSVRQAETTGPPGVFVGEAVQGLPGREINHTKLQCIYIYIYMYIYIYIYIYQTAIRDRFSEKVIETLLLRRKSP